MDADGEIEEERSEMEGDDIETPFNRIEDPVKDMIGKGMS